MLELIINGQRQQVDVDPHTLLLCVLRDTFGLTATRFGRGFAQRGACTVHLNGQAVRSWELPVSAMAGAEVLTIEGLGAERFARFRTPGSSSPSPSAATARADR